MHTRNIFVHVYRTKCSYRSGSTETLDDLPQRLDTDLALRWQRFYFGADSKESHTPYAHHYSTTLRLYVHIRREFGVYIQ
jgi:hypothetical protein